MLLLKLEAAGTRFRWQDALGLTALSAVWANMHGSFFLAPAIALIYWAGMLVRPLIWNIGRENRTHWYLFAALSLAAGSLANPFGTALHAHVYRYLNDTELLQRVGEFQSFNFHVEGAFQILLMLGVAALGGVLALSRKNVAHFLLTVLFLAVALRGPALIKLSLCLPRGEQDPQDSHCKMAAEFPRQ